jgi:DNA-binding NarL/FixJ family response regulator
VTVSIVLIHDDDAVRAALVRQFEAADDLVLIASVRMADAGVGAFADQPDAVVLVQQQAVDATGRIAAFEEIRRISQDARIVMLTDAEDSSVTLAAIRSGAAGVLPTASPSLVDAVRLVASGIRVFDPAVVAVLVGTLIDPPTSPLSSREREVLSCLAIGLSNAQAATRLFVSRETVKTHVANLLRKLDVDDRVAAVNKAIKIGLLT